jgi:hypothetical protein
MWFYNDSVGWGVGGGGKIIHTTNSGMPVAVANNSGNMPDNFILYQNYPNPFNISTIIEFEIPKRGHVTIKIYNILGKEIRTIVNEVLSPGKYKTVFNADNLSSEIYFYKLVIGANTAVKKMVLIK